MPATSRRRRRVRGDGHSRVNGAALPIRKWIVAGSTAGRNEFGNTLAPCEELLEEVVQRILVTRDPVTRNPFPGPIDDFLGKTDHLIQPRLEIVYGPHGFVDTPPRIQSLQRRFGKVPIGPVERKAVIDHAGDEAGTGSAGPVLTHHRAIKDTLPSVGVAHPLVEYQNGSEIFQVHDLRQQGIGKIVVHSQSVWVAWIPRAEMPARLDIDSMGAERQMNVAVGGEEWLADLDQCGFGRGDL